MGSATMLHAQTFTEVPADLTTTTWDVEAVALESDNVTETPISYKCQVGILDDKIYIQGLAQRFPDAWVMGTVDNYTLTIEAGQELGKFTSSNGGKYDIYFSGYLGDNNTTIIDAKWEYDSYNQAIYGDYFVTTAQLSSILALDVLSNISLYGPLDEEGIHSVIAPAADGAAYTLSGQRMAPVYGHAASGIVIQNGRKTLK